MSYCYCENCKKPYGNAHIPWWFNKHETCGNYPDLLDPINVSIQSKYANRSDILNMAIDTLLDQYGYRTLEILNQLNKELSNLGFFYSIEHKSGQFIVVAFIDTNKIIGDRLVFEINRKHRLSVYWKKDLSENKVSSPCTCTCTISTLMTQGCKCGTFQKEQNAKTNSQI